MTDSTEPRLPTQYTRPDLAWAEELLGESLGPLPEPALDYIPTGDASVIPRGEYCYDAEDESQTPCPYQSETDYGTVKCSFMKVEAYNDQWEFPIERMSRYFGGVDAALAAGVVADFWLVDGFKRCGKNVQRPGFGVGLASLIREYRAEVESQPGIEVPTADKPGWDFKPMTEWMIRTAWTRLELWEHMTGMVEDIPPELIHALMVADKRFRVKTFPSSELMDPDFAKRMPPHVKPNRQYWYMYRKNLGEPLKPGEKMVLYDPISFFPPGHV